MSLTLIEINGEMIPSSICLCYAFEPGECCCATTAWEGYRYEWEDEDDTAQTDVD